MRAPALAVLVLLAACGQPLPLVVEPSATLPPPTTKVTPPPGPFNGTVTLTFETDRPATVYVSLDGSDPRNTTAGRVSGPSPLTVTLQKTATLKYFASVDAKDEELQTGQWVRAGGPVGTITGVVVVGDFAAGKKVGVSNNGAITELGKPAQPTELPFHFEGLKTGTYRLSALSDRNGDDVLLPFIDFESAAVTVQLDLADPFKASAENVRLYLGASATGLGTLQGVITLPKPPTLQSLQISALSGSSLTVGTDPTALLQQLQAGYRIFTTPMQTEYPYVITDLTPGRYIPVPSLFGFGGGGLALNLLANPLAPVNVVADQTATADFAFGPVAISGSLQVHPTAAPTGLAWGIVAARSAALSGMQVVLMPVVFTVDPATGDLKGNYAGECLKANSSFAVRVFTSATSAAGSSPLTDALGWAINPFAPLPAHATIQTQTVDVVQPIVVP